MVLRDKALELRRETTSCSESGLVEVIGEGVSCPQTARATNPFCVLEPNSTAMTAAMEPLESAISSLLALPITSTLRLQALADYLIKLLVQSGLPSATGGSERELKVPGLARTKNWDVAYEFAGKFRLLVSLKSMLKNISGTVPNRLDDLQGELANVQQLRPEIVIGYVILSMWRWTRNGRMG